MKAKFDVFEALKNNGFELAPNAVPEYWGDTLERTFKRTCDVLWYGVQEFTVTVKVHFNKDRSVVSVDYFDGHKSAFKSKVHLNDKRCFNAICETLKNKGYAM